MRKDKIDIVYQDKDMIIVNKPHNLLTVATQKEKEKTMYHKVLLFEKQKHKSNKIFVVHRLDKDTSGLLIFAKSERVKKLLQDNWSSLVKYRGYVALVEGIPPLKEDVIKSYLKETKTFLTISSSDKKYGKQAITKYKVIRNKGNKSLVDIEILTGRKNQIRVHMKDIGTPIIGDKKYGNKSKDKITRMYLHAYKLHFIHPINKKELSFELSIPSEFEI